LIFADGSYSAVEKPSIIGAEAREVIYDFDD
jgi:hypothetical protein